MRKRFAVLLALLLSASTGVFLACSSDETPATTPTDPADGSSGGTSDTGSSGSSGKEGGLDKDSGITYTTGQSKCCPSGVCPLKTTDFVSGKKAENIAIAAGADWTNPEGALSEDDKIATVTLNDGQQSAELRISDFGLAIPETAETWGIEVELKRRAPDGGVADDKINLLIEGKPTIFKYVGTPWPISIVGTHHYGQAIDTWGVDLYPADVNKSTFAARLTAKRYDAGAIPVVAQVDSMKVAVHYCEVK